MDSGKLNLVWDVGTAYEFFVSLFVLHTPDRFGLRPSWAAGVRSRLTSEDRKVLETAQDALKIPLGWIHQLPQPKDANTMLCHLEQLPPLPRLEILTRGDLDAPDPLPLLHIVWERRGWDEGDLEALRQHMRQPGRDAPRSKVLVQLLDIWADAERFSNRYLSALLAYQTAFFQEEEQHLSPELYKGLQQAQALSKDLPLPALLEHLSQGVYFEGALSGKELILAPSYWSTPLIFIQKIAPEQTLILFGARPEDASLVPGELVPAALLHGLKAIADPTRLRILRYLAQQPLTQAGLARRLRLRAPTVTHHLSALRLAGLVHLTLAQQEERRYTARLETISTLFDHLGAFLTSDLQNEPESEQPDLNQE